jgi:23S rRNA (adenine2030-N6)-methyltransferase
MNYRHAFHAGNHIDVFKHAALTLVLERLKDKDQPFAVLDSHAGIGVYDLASDEAERTGEFKEGVARVFDAPVEAAPDYSRLIHEMNPDGLAAYPGSPEVARRLLRQGDRLVLCELHPADVATLKARYRTDPRVGVHHRDGYEAIAALVPPPERRGLVLVDPPFEKTDEVQSLVRAVDAGLKRWATGSFMIWHPIKDRTIADALSSAARRWPKSLRAELCPYAPGESSLPGGGLIFVNTPWKLDGRLKVLAGELAGRLGTGNGSWSVEWLNDQ